jgi:hypothetical protein
MLEEPEGKQLGANTAVLFWPKANEQHFINHDVDTNGNDGEA